MSPSSPVDDPDDPLQPVKDVVGDSTVAISVLAAVVSLVTGFVPGSPFLGGALAGYLVRRDRGRGAWVGALSGLLVAIPTALFILFAFGFTAVLATLSLPSALFGVIAAAFGFMGLSYTVGLAAIGGYLGVVAYERRQKTASQRHQTDRSGRDSVSEDARSRDRR